MSMLLRRSGLAAAVLALLATATPALSQAFRPGPAGTPVGSSMSGARIDGAPERLRGPRIPNADIFGDEAGERALGRDYDDSYLTPDVRRRERDGTAERRAVEGRSALDGVGAGVFAREGPRAIGGSSVTRPSSKGRARIVVTRPRKAR